MSHFYTPWKRQETYGMMKLEWVKVDIILLAIQNITCHNTVWQFEKLPGATKSVKVFTRFNSKTKYSAQIF